MLVLYVPLSFVQEVKQCNVGCRAVKHMLTLHRSPVVIDRLDKVSNSGDELVSEPVVQ